MNSGYNELGIEETQNLTNRGGSCLPKVFYLGEEAFQDRVKEPYPSTTSSGASRPSFSGSSEGREDAIHSVITYLYDIFYRSLGRVFLRASHSTIITGLIGCLQCGFELELQTIILTL